LDSSERKEDYPLYMPRVGEEHPGITGITGNNETNSWDLDLWALRVVTFLPELSER